MSGTSSQLRIRTAQRQLDKARREYKSCLRLTYANAAVLVGIAGLWTTTVHWGTSTTGNTISLTFAYIGLSIVSIVFVVLMLFMVSAALPDQRNDLEKVEWAYEDEVLNQSGMS